MKMDHCSNIDSSSRCCRCGDICTVNNRRQLMLKKADVMLTRCSLIYLTLLFIQPNRSARLRASYNMDSFDSCDLGIRRPQHDLVKGDVFVVNSDSFQGKATGDRAPPECMVGVNLGDRFLSVILTEWSCDHVYEDPLFVGVYDDCHKTRRKEDKLLAWFNCSSQPPFTPIQSTSSCVYIYHYRGNRQGGYFFTLHIIAGHELIPFPAGGMAAIVIAAIVGSLIIAKVACVVSGYERRLPKISALDDEVDDDNDEHFYTDDQTKQICASGGAGSRPMSERPSSVVIITDQSSSTENSSQITMGPGDGRGVAAMPWIPGSTLQCYTTGGGSTGAWVTLNEGDPYLSAAASSGVMGSQHHSTLRVTRSNGSHASSNGSSGGGGGGGGVAGGGSERSSVGDYDYDFLEGHGVGGGESDSVPRLKRYPSARASIIWRHQ